MLNVYALVSFLQNIKRRKPAPPGLGSEKRGYESATLPERRSRAGPPTTTINLKKPEKEGFGFSMAFRLYIKDVKRDGVADFGGLQRDHVVQKVCNFTLVDVQNSIL